MPTDTIEREIVIAAPVERVWEIVTEPEHMGRWFGDAGAERDGDTITDALGGARRGRAARRALRAARTCSPTAGTRTCPGSATRSSSSRSRPRATGRGCASSRAASPHWPPATTEQERLREGNVGGWEHELGDLERYAASVAV